MIGIVVIVYSADPEKLIRSVEENKAHRVKWYIFFHGYSLSLLKHVQQLSCTINARVYPFFLNRGVAKSWNDGILFSMKDGNEMTLLINDDIVFYADGFNSLIDFAKTERSRQPDFALLAPFGLETDGIHRGAVQYQYFACGMLGHSAIDKIGFFDENFYPAYYEDNDYLRRIRLAGLPLIADERVLVEHARSSTLRENPEIAEMLQQIVPENTEYYISKWGGVPGEERFTRPFNDPAVDCYIAAIRRRTPYGPQRDRHPITRKFRR